VTLSLDLSELAQPPAADGFRVLVDLNAFSLAKLKRVPAGGLSSRRWRVGAHAEHAPRGERRDVEGGHRDHLGSTLTVSEDDPMQISECGAAVRLPWWRAPRPTLSQ
jgi:hypothetical protein